MRVPVVTGGLVSNDVIKPITIVSVQTYDFSDSRADGLIVFLDKFLLSARLVHDEHLIRFILTSYLMFPRVF